MPRKIVIKYKKFLKPLKNKMVDFLSIIGYIWSVNTSDSNKAFHNELHCSS